MFHEFSNIWFRNHQPGLYLFIYLGFYIAFNTVQVISQLVVGRTDETSTYSSSGFCKLPTNGKQLPAFQLEAVPGTKTRAQKWEARELPLCHRGPPQPGLEIKFLSKMMILWPMLHICQVQNTVQN